MRKQAKRIVWAAALILLLLAVLSGCGGSGVPKGQNLSTNGDFAKAAGAVPRSCWRKPTTRALCRRWP